MVNKFKAFKGALTSANNYYCLVSGLPELSLEQDGHGLDFDVIKQEIAGELSAEDLAAVEFLYAFYDVENLVNYLHNSSLPFNSLGNLTQQQIMEHVEHTLDDQEPFESLLPREVSAVLDRYKGRVEQQEDVAPLALEDMESELYAHFYGQAAQSSNRFVRQWSVADRTIRNIVVASRARTLGVDGTAMMVGGGELEQQMLSSQAADFGLRGEFEYFEQLWAVLETEDFVERERKMDTLRWSVVETLTEQDYFDMDFLMGYMVKLNIMYRWVALDKEIGRQRFSQIVDSFKVELNN